jgi:hypothetical protein
MPLPRLRRSATALLLVAALFASVAAAAAEAKPRSGLAPGKSLRPGQALVAGAARLSMRGNGDLVLLYVPRRARSPLARRAKAPGRRCSTRRCRFLRPRTLWRSGTAGHPDAQLRMRASGTAVVVAGGRILWSSRSRGPGAHLRLGRDGNLGIYRGGAAASSLEEGAEALWQTGTETPEYAGDELGPGETLGPNRYLQSANGQYELDMTPEGWLALWVRGAGPCPMFVAPSAEGSGMGARVPGSSLEMEASGRLSIRGPEAAAPILWTMRNYDNPHESAQPTPVPGSRLVLENDGNLAVLAPGGEVVWQTETERVRGPVLCPGESLFYGQVLGSVYSGIGSQYQGGYYLQIATANRGRGSEVDVVGASRLSVSHVYRSKTGPSATGMYLRMQDDGDLQLLLDGGDGIPIWETGTAFPNSFATASSGALQIYAPLVNSSGQRAFLAIYEKPDLEEETTKGISQSEKLSMTLAPLG